MEFMSSLFFHTHWSKMNFIPRLDHNMALKYQEQLDFTA